MTLFEEKAVASSGAPVISVGELNRLVRAAIEKNLPLTWVNGEISNLRRYDSGHVYFTLKDASAQVDCVMFRHKAQFLDWQPTDGMRVEVRALATVYEARGIVSRVDGMADMDDVTKAIAAILDGKAL